MRALWYMEKVPDTDSITLIVSAIVAGIAAGMGKVMYANRRKRKTGDAQIVSSDPNIQAVVKNAEASMLLASKLDHASQMIIAKMDSLKAQIKNQEDVSEAARKQLEVSLVRLENVVVRAEELAAKLERTAEMSQDPQKMRGTRPPRKMPRAITSNANPILGRPSTETR